MYEGDPFTQTVLATAGFGGLAILGVLELAALWGLTAVWPRPYDLILFVPVVGLEWLFTLHNTGLLLWAWFGWGWALVLNGVV